VAKAHAEAYRSDAEAEGHARDGRDAELEYRSQLEEDDMGELEEQPGSQEEPEMQPRAVSEPLTEARLAAMEKAAEQVIEEEQEEGDGGSTETAE
jgi:hypothetical protein